MVEGAVLPHEPAAGDADRGSAVHQAEERVQRALARARVSGFRARTYSDVASRSTRLFAALKPTFFVERDQPDVGELATHDVRRSVAGRVVDDGYGNPLCVFMQRLEAPAQQRAAPVRHDHDFHHGAPR